MLLLRWYSSLARNEKDLKATTAQGYVTYMPGLSEYKFSFTFKIRLMSQEKAVSSISNVST